MEQQALEFVLTENHIVTFRSLSRHLGITVNESKQLLESIAEKNKLHCVCQVFEHNKDGIAIHIRKGYLGSEIGHVWAVAPFEVNDFDAILNIDQQVSLNDTPESQQASRVISNDGIIIGRSSRKPIEAAQPKTATKKSGSKQEDVKGSENTSEPRAADPKPKKQSLSSFFGQRAKERKESKDNEEVTVKKVKPSVKPKDKPVEKPSESLDKPVEKQAEKKAEKPSQKVINRPVEKPAPVVQIVSAKSKEQADQIKKLFDEEPQKKHEAPPLEKQRVRKRRKVQKTRQYMEGNYIKTEDYTDWESYSEEEVKSAPKPEKSKAQKSGNQMQSKLASFFKRK